MSHSIPKSFNYSGRTGAVRFPTNEELIFLREQAKLIEKGLGLNDAEIFLKFSLSNFPEIVEYEINKFKADLNKKNIS